ncbi:POLD2 [Lepeophtheirus salmonis]|nr:POLD2 [Lepeophtheirus salmonis]CAF2805668.1 POLD2 [Lepeophtheirus salmonis]
MKPYVERSIRESALGEDASIRSLSHLSDGNSKPCCVIGTLYKLQKKKPNILRELEGEVEESSPLNSDFTSEDDQLILEDEDQRVKLIGKIATTHLVTGLVLGVYGKHKDGKLDVEQVFFPRSERIKRYIPLRNMYIAFISNIQVSHDSSQVLENLQLAMDWLTGFEGCPRDQEENASIERLVVAGGLLGKECSKKGGGDEDIFESVRLLENALLQLVKSIKVDIIPGQSDELSNASMPQQPLHKCLFPRAAAYASTFQTVTNPYFFQIEGTKIYGSSGKNVEDIVRNSSLKDPLQVMEEILKWGHISPTSPDTLGCFPYKDKDPFVMEFLPHVLFSAIHGKEHLSKFTNNTLLFTIPNFSTSGSLVLLNLKDLSTKEIKFSTN